jgi:ribonuclease HI
LVTSPKGESFKGVLQMHLPASNNVAEYEAFLHGVRIAIALDIHWLRVLRDSLHVVNQANKEWSCLDDKMMMYGQELHKLENNYDSLKYMHILRGKNEVADEPKITKGYLCRNSMSQGSPRCWLKPTRQPAQLRSLHHQLRASLSRQKS